MAPAYDRPASIDQVEYHSMITAAAASTARDAIDGATHHAVVSGLSFSPDSATEDMAWAIAEIFPDLEPVPQGLGGETSHLIRAPRRSSEPTTTELLFPASTRYMEPHTDGAYLQQPGINYVALACLGQAYKGGATSIVSATSLLDRVAAIDPVVADRLFQPFPFGALEAGMTQDIVWEPIFSIIESDVAVRLHRFRIYKAYGRLPGGIDTAAKRALDVVGTALAEEALQLRFTLAAGDLLVLDNRRALHGRERFSNGTAGAGRELVRMWFRRREGAPVR